MKSQTQHITTKYYVQLSLFPETNEERNAREIKELRETCTKLRKSLHAKNSDLAKKYNQLQHEFEIFKSSICKFQSIQQHKQSSFL